MPSLLPTLKARVAAAISGVVALKAEYAAEELTAVTPVDTGRAKSNWLLGVSSVPSFALASFNPGTALGMRMAVVAGYDHHNGPLVLTNNVEYAGQLNRGYAADANGRWIHGSLQQPFPGWMELAISRGMEKAIL